MGAGGKEVSAALNDIASTGDAIDYLVTKGFKPSEAVEFIGRITKIGKKTKAAPAASSPEPRKVKRPWPAEFALTDQLIKFATDRGFNPIEITRMWERFRDRNMSRGEQYADWNAAWRTWVNNQVEFKNQRTQPRAPDHIDGRL
jgi:hypothetical protein